MKNKWGIPLAVLEKHAVILGKTGKGKSSLLRLMVEHLLEHNKRVCIIDPKGDHWGIKSSADGRGPGFPVILFGDFKGKRSGDVPINERSGKHVAELISSGNRPCVIGFNGWSQNKMTAFWIDFVQTLFHTNPGELYLVGDEFHNLAPKGKILTPQAGECLYWSNKVLGEGRGLGLICLIATQRPQKLHNDCLTQCETLFAMGVTHSADRKAVKEWIDGCGDVAQGKIVLDSIARLQRGEAYVWSPEINYGPELVKFPKFSTFDSFAPPQAQPKVLNQGWADVNLDDVKAKLATVIEEAKANDPKELKAEISRLKTELVKVNREKVKPEKAETAVAKPEILEVPVLNAKELKQLEKLISETADVKKELDIVSVRMEELISENSTIRGLMQVRLKPLQVKLQTPHRPQSFLKATTTVPMVKTWLAPIVGAGNSQVELPKGEQQILQVCIQFPDGVSREQLTILTGFKRSTRDAYISRMVPKGLLDAPNGGLVTATDAGRAALPYAQPLPTGEELQALWLAKLPQGEKVILEILLQAYPEEVDKEKLDELTGFKRSTRDAYLVRMRAKQIITEPKPGTVVANANLF